MDDHTERPHLSPQRKEHQRSRSAAVLGSEQSTLQMNSPAKQRLQQGTYKQPRSPYDYSITSGSCQILVDDPFTTADPSPAGPLHVLNEVQNWGVPSLPRQTPKQKGGGLFKAAVKHKKSMSEIIAQLSPKKSSKELRSMPKDKENTTPPATAHADLPTPIWAQYASQPSQNLNWKGSCDDKALSAARPLSTQVKGDHSSSQQPGSPSKVKAAVAALNQKTVQCHKEDSTTLSGEELDAAFDKVLLARNIPENMHATMRGLDPNVKREFIKNEIGTSKGAEQAVSTSPTKSSFWSRSRGKSFTRGRDTQKEVADSSKDGRPSSPNKRDRSQSRGRGFTLGRGEKSPSKRPRSNSRPRSLMSLKNLSSSSLSSHCPDTSNGSKETSSPEVFCQYLQAQQHVPQQVEIGKVHKLRILVRNESVGWTESFIAQSGMDALMGLLHYIMQMEWREEHEDMLMHEVLLCLKGLCTTRRGQDKLAQKASTIFPNLLKLLFDDERKGPSEYNTRSIIIHLLFSHLAAAQPGDRATRAQDILGYLKDPSSPEDDLPVGFIAQMQQHRPFQLWCKEITNVTKEVFWIFLHHLNVVTLIPASGDASGEHGFLKLHFPQERPPVPAAPYIGGVEWDANNYIAQHLDLLNGLVASLPSQHARNELRAELKASGFEKLMGATLRLCKEKFYGAIHDVLKTWISAAAADAWPVEEVRMGPPQDNASPSRSPKKTKMEPAPKLDLPKLVLGVTEQVSGNFDAWL